MTGTAGAGGADGHLGVVRAIIGSHLLVVPGVAGAVVDGDRVLLQLHGDTRRWVLPGGAVEPFEQPADAVVREVREETGLEVRPDAIVAVDGGVGHHVRYRNGDEVSYVTSVFRCTPFAGRLHADGVETLDLRWATRSAIADDPDVAPWVRAVLPHLEGDHAAFTPPTP